MIKAGGVDIAPTSSIIYAKNFRDFLILPGFSLSAFGRTGSILLFSDLLKPGEHLWHELEGKTVAVPGTSESSSVLLEIILRMKGIRAKIIYHKEPHLDKMLKKADSALLIGDDALKADFDGREVLCDLGAEWKELTGQKMVYALWVIRKEAAEKNPGEVSIFHSKLAQSRKKAMEDIEAISAELAVDMGVSQKFMKSHLETLDFGLGSDVICGLNEYFGKAFDCGIIKERPTLNFFEVKDAG